MIPTPTEFHQVAEENKPNRLFNSILELKKERKEKKDALNDMLSTDQLIAGLEQEAKFLKDKVKDRKKILMAQKSFDDVKKSIEELNQEIKNDSEILKDFAIVAFFLEL